MIYVVLGMHKSGTSLAAELLHHAGINMVDNLDEGMTYDEGQKYERRSVQNLNLDILAARGKLSITIKPLGVAELPEEHQARMRQIIADCQSSYEDWGFKHPTTTLIYPHWAAHLPEHKIVVTFRPISQLWPRYRSLIPPRAMRRAWQLVVSWCEHNRRILDYLRDTKMDYVVLSYNRLMASDEEFARLAAFTGRDLVDRRAKTLYRSRWNFYPLLSLAEWFYRLRKGIGPRDILAQLEALANGG